MSLRATFCLVYLLICSEIGCDTYDLSGNQGKIVKLRLNPTKEYKLPKTPPEDHHKFSLQKKATDRIKAGMNAYYKLVHNITRLPKQLIIINAPARSGTSMLTYILCNHPHICGYGETKVIYDSKESIHSLVSQVCRASRKLWINERYFLDKIVYNKYLHDISVFDDFDVKWIFLLRDPHSTVKSFINYFNKSEQRALHYYDKRLKKLATQAKHLKDQNLKDQNRSLFITYESLTSQTERTLAIITNFLDLDEPLIPSYKHNGAIQRYRAGDHSESIESGKILSKPRKYHVKVSNNTLIKAAEAHNNCQNILKECCLVAETVSSDDSESKVS